MELRTLRYFLTIAQEGSISAAAAVLHITQPTLSRQIMDLERELGVPLFLRGRRSHRLALTEQGLLLRQRAAELLELADKTSRELQPGAEEIRGELQIGCAESESMRTVVRALHMLQQRYPLLRYHLFSGTADMVIERLDRGLLDFGVVLEPIERQKYHSLRLPRRDRWGLLMRKDHPLAQRESVRAEDLVGLPLVTAREQLARDFVSAWSHVPAERLQIVGTCTLIYNASLLVEAGMCCVLCLEHLTDSGSESPLCFRPLSPQLEANLDVIWKRGSVLMPPAQKFIQTLETVCSAEQTPE